jgi:hypothetical protein
MKELTRRGHRIWTTHGLEEGAMRPSVLIIEPRREVAAALEDVVNSANYVAVVRPHLERLADLVVPPAAIIVRVVFEGGSEPAHAAIARLPHNHPPVVAIACADAEVAEAQRLKCDVVLHAPGDVGRLCEALGRVVHA